MGRRSTKPSPATGALPFDTVGVTILPGISLPEWAQPGSEWDQPTGPELIADAEPVDQVVSPEAAAPAFDAHAAQPAWAAAPAAHQAPMEHQPMAPQPAFAMAGAGLVGAASGAPAGYGQSAPAYGQSAPAYGQPAPAYGQPAAPPAEPSRYPAAPSAGPAAPWAPPAPPAPPSAPAGPGQGFPAPGAATQDHPTTEALTTAGPDVVAGTAEPPAPPAPSEAWGSPERATLSPQHVALLSWWADMMAAGQFPPPVAVPGQEASPTTAPSAEPRRRAFPLRAAAISLVAVAALGAAAVVGPKVLAAEDPVGIPITHVSMPATVGGLESITGPEVGTELETLLGFGLRPAGATATSAYGSASEGPLALAAMATTMGAPAEAVGQIATWAERTGATVAPSVPGTGANEGITCAAVAAIPDAEPGSFCVWTATGKRGQTYSVATSVEDAQTLTNQLRTAITGT